MAKKIKILSIDGGGIRGIIPGTIISYIEDQLRYKQGNEKRISDYFDLIAGTSTGGILTCAYLMPDSNGRPALQASEAVNIYKEKGEAIFTKKSFSKIRKLYDETYNASALESALRETFEDTKLSDLLKPCLISTYDIKNRKSTFFNSVDGQSELKNYFVRDIARATSAAPTYFEAANIHSLYGTSYPLIDGGMIANNPSMCAYSEARTLAFSKILNDSEKIDFPAGKDMMIVSIGTGSESKPYEYDKAKDWGLIEWVQPIIDIMMSGSSEIVDYQLKQLFDATQSSNQYHRLEPSRYNACPEMDDASPKNLMALEEAGKKYIEDHYELLDQIVDQVIYS